MGFMWTDQIERALLAPPVAPNDSLDFLDTKKSKEGRNPLLTRILAGGLLGILALTSTGCTKVEFETSANNEPVTCVPDDNLVEYTFAAGDVFDDALSVTTIDPRCIELSKEIVREIVTTTPFSPESYLPDYTWETPQPGMSVLVPISVLPNFYVASK